jgi:gas vesicle protein
LRNEHDKNHDKNKEKSMNSNNTLYFLLGLGMGAAAGVFYAPKSGSQTRDFLRSKSEEGTRYAKKTARDAGGLAKQKADELKKTASDTLDHATKSVKVPIENLGSAIEAGKKAYQEAGKGIPGKAT